MNPEWFEEVDGEHSRFYQVATNYYGVGYLATIDRAFRQLLAEDANEGSLALFSDCVNALDDRITAIEMHLAKLDRSNLEREAEKLTEMLSQATHGRDQFRDLLDATIIERGSLQAQLDAANAALAVIRTRVKKGKVVYATETQSVVTSWHYNRVTYDDKTALLIDEADIAPAVEPMLARYDHDSKIMKMCYEERKRERRQS